MKKIITAVLLFSGIIVSTASGVRPDIQEQLDQAYSNYTSAIASQPVADELDDWFERETKLYASEVRAIVDNAGEGMTSQEKEKIIKSLQQ